MNCTMLGFEDQIAVAIDAKFARAFDGEVDRIRIGAWSDHIVVLKLPLITVVDKIDAGIY